MISVKMFNRLLFAKEVFNKLFAIPLMATLLLVFVAVIGFNINDDIIIIGTIVIFAVYWLLFFFMFGTRYQNTHNGNE